MTGRVDESPAAPGEHGFEGRFPGKYLSVTSFKRDGAGVATPVWFVVENGRLLIHTGSQSGKAKRIRRNPSVLIAPCTASGRLRGDPVSAMAEFLSERDSRQVMRLLERKYRVDRVLLLPLYRLVQWLRGARTGGASVAIAITPLAASSSSRQSEEKS
ncbi:MAG TPA: PPOX class F420-dependent oxidoreductase [Solirubrobacteraceae bacterium]|nr:PPOX class F420-dependent oxidoreductase [Solirubrobacteraceae bacterium]